MKEYVDDFKENFPSILELPKRLEKKRSADPPELTTVVDVAGFALGSDINADQTINVVLQRGAEMKYEPLENPQHSRYIVAGDIAEPEKQQELLDTIDAKADGAVDCIFLRPGAAFSPKDKIRSENPYAGEQLMFLILRLTKKLKPDGEMYIRIDKAYNPDWCERLPVLLQSFSETDVNGVLKRKIRNGMYVEYKTPHLIRDKDAFSQLYVRITRQ